MKTQINWQKLRSELQRLSNVEQLKSEVNRLKQEVRGFDLQSVLSPAAKAKVKMFEKKYTELVKAMHQTQRQMDRELARFMREVTIQTTDLTKTFKQQRSRLEKLSSDVQQRFANLTKSRKKTGKRATTRKRKPTVKRAHKTTDA